MRIVNFFESDRQDHWLAELGKCDWSAGRFLHRLLSTGAFFEAVGVGSRVLLLTEGDDLISFCTYAKKDDIQPTELSPWMGFVYTFPAWRGRRYAGELFREAERLAGAEGADKIYISTNHTGLYEKYGCEYYTQMNDMDGCPSRVYVKKIGA